MVKDRKLVEGPRPQGVVKKGKVGHEVWPPPKKNGTREDSMRGDSCLIKGFILLSDVFTGYRSQIHDCKRKTMQKKPVRLDGEKSLKGIKAEVGMSFKGPRSKTGLGEGECRAKAHFLRCGRTVAGSMSRPPGF